MRASMTGLVTCMSCGRKVIENKFQIHQALCRSKQQYSEQLMSTQTKPDYSSENLTAKLKPQKGISIVSKFQKISLKPYKVQKKKEVTKLQRPRKSVQQQAKPDTEQVDVQLIPCLQCGSSIPFCLYAEHEQQCTGRDLRQCDFCGLKFPTMIYQEHLQVCKFVPENQQNSGDLDFNFQLRQHISRVASQQIPEEKKEIKGLTPEQIKKIKTLTKYREQKDCSICYSNMKSNQRILELPCKHLFHKACLQPWVIANPHCPMCKRDVLGRN